MSENYHCNFLCDLNNFSSILDLIFLCFCVTNMMNKLVEDYGGDFTKIDSVNEEAIFHSFFLSHFLPWLMTNLCSDKCFLSRSKLAAVSIEENLDNVDSFSLICI